MESLVTHDCHFLIDRKVHEYSFLNSVEKKRQHFCSFKTILFKSESNTQDSTLGLKNKNTRFYMVFKNNMNC